MDLVSVIIPTYNRFDSVHYAIQSVLNQTYQNVEIIVVNDCSTDMRYYNFALDSYPRTTVIHLPQNLRVKYNVAAAQGKTKVVGMQAAKGQWIAFLDDDDYWYPQKLELQFKYVSMHPDAQMCSTNMHVGHGTYSPTLPRQLYFPQSLPVLFTKDIIKECNYINNSSVLIKKELCDRVGEFVLGKNEDHEYWLRALEYTNCVYVSEPLIYYDLAHCGAQQYS